MVSGNSEGGSKVNTGSSAAGGSGAATAENEEKRDERTFECNICLDTARDAVVSMCGHLFW